MHEKHQMNAPNRLFDTRIHYLSGIYSDIYLCHRLIRKMYGFMV